MATTNLIAATELLQRLDDKDLRLIDARFELSDPAYGAAAYALGHIPGALYLGLDTDLSGATGRHGGRHPLPNMQRFAQKLGDLGVGPQHQVVVYDQSGAMYAARAWWLLRYAGHQNVRFLDGGLAAYLAAGGSLDTATPAYRATQFPLDLQPHMVVDVQHVKRSLADRGVLLLDARAGERYRGEVEPLDAKAGHIPGAVNRFYQESLDQEGRFHQRQRLAAQLALPEGKREVIAYCGSGVSGAHLVLALEQAGVEGAKLYTGSWSDWSSYDDLPVAVGEEK